MPETLFDVVVLGAGPTGENVAELAIVEEIPLDPLWPPSLVFQL